MKISKKEALKLLREKRFMFEKILESSNPNIKHPLYHKAYYGTENLLAQLFSEKKKNEFRKNVTAWGMEKDDVRHMRGCIDEIDIAIETIENIWPDEEEDKTKKGHIPLPFVSISFTDKDKEINDYFTGLLKALSIEYLTGEPYSKKSVPEKVKSRIDKSDIVISILTRRHQIQGDKYTTSAWCIKEISYAQGKGKDAIIITEKNINEIAGLDYEKDIIYLDRKDIKSIQKATIKFIEALNEHGFIE